MSDTLSRLWWATVLRGVAAVLFDVLALVWPAATLLVLVIFFGAYVLVDGVLNVATAIAGGRGDAGSRAWVAAQGLAGIVVGVLTFAWPGVTAGPPAPAGRNHLIRVSRSRPRPAQHRVPPYPRHQGLSRV